MTDGLAGVQILTLLLVAVGMSLTLAHALETPGKLRLPKDTYTAAQPIYYPGFTIGAFFGEFGALAPTAALAFVTPRGSTAFWLTLATFFALLLSHGLYWVLIHPVNKVWMRGRRLKGAGATFFGLGKGIDVTDWMALRNRWEYSHVVRAVVTTAGFALLAGAVAIE